jgi:MoaE-MoaD fusion protein
MSQVKVKLFAAFREAVGRSEVDVQLPERATVAEVARALGEQYPVLARMLASGRPVVNQQFVSPDEPISPGDDIAFVPPVSGGSAGG